MTRHLAKLEYKCPTGMEYKINDNSTAASVNMTCNWNETWSTTLPTCVCESIYLYALIFLPAAN